MPNKPERADFLLSEPAGFAAPGSLMKRGGLVARKPYAARPAPGAKRNARPASATNVGKSEIKCQRSEKVENRLDLGRTVNTLAAAPDLETLKAEVFRVLAEFERDGHPVADFGAELMKLGIAISMATAGPNRTIAGALFLTKQLLDIFPDALPTVRAEIEAAGRA
jgi:hypothetical protein